MSQSGTYGEGSGGGGDITKINTDSGSATPIAGVVTIKGGSNINTSGATNVVTINLDDNVTISGNYTTTAGNAIIPFANSTGTEGLIISGGGTSNLAYMNNGSLFGLNLYMGDAGNLTANEGANVAIGPNALLSQTASTGATIAIGRSCLQNSTDSSFNVALGIDCFKNTTSGVSSCIGIGNEAGYNITAITGTSDCIFIGSQSGNSHGGGSANIAIGAQNLPVFDDAAGGFVTTVGANSLSMALSGNNTSAYGFNVLSSIVSGGFNTCIGSYSGTGYSGSENNNIILGMQAGTTSENGAIRIGNISGTTTGVTTSTSCYIQGISGVTVTGAAVLCSSSGQLGTISSSIRYKENIRDINENSDPIFDLRPVKFKYKSTKLDHYGLIAEEVQKVLPELIVYDSEGKPDSVAYHELPVLLLNEMKKMRKRIEELEEKVK